MTLFAQYPTSADALNALMAYKRKHLTPRAKRRLPAYSANWKVIGPADTSTTEIEHSRSDVTVFCTLHEVWETSKPRYLLNSSNSALKYPCRACAIESRKDTNNPSGTTWRLLKEHFANSEDWEFLAAVAPACGNQLGRAKCNERCTARCTKTIPGTGERCSRTTTQTVGNWLYHFRHPEKNHLKCQGECCSSQKGHGKRLSQQTQHSRLTSARAGTWLPCPSRNSARWTGLGARKWYIHTPCGFAVYRTGNAIIDYPRTNNLPADTDQDCPLCTGSLSLPVLNKDLDLLKHWVERVSNGKVRFIGERFPAGPRNDQQPFLEVRCQTHHHDFLATLRQMRSSTSFGCQKCTSALITQPRAWKEEEAAELLRRRGFTPLATPGDYADPIPMRHPDGSTIHASTFAIITQYPASITPPPTKPGTAGQPSRSGLPYSPAEDAVLREMAQSGQHHWADIAVRLNRTPGSIKQRAIRLGANNARTDHRRFMTHNDAFDRYTPDSCFFAGLLAADGCISTKNRITIELKAIDELLLQAFMEFIGLHNTIKYRAIPKITQWRGIYAAIGWKNLNHIRSLEDNFGITKQKSLTLSPPTIHDPDCEFAFFAGLFAGDGHVSLTSTPCINIVTASQHCSDWLQSFYGRRGIRFHHALRMNKKSSMHEIEVFSRDAVSLAAQLARVKNLEIGMARKWRVLQEIAHKQSLA